MTDDSDAATHVARSFSIGDVLGTSFGVLGRNLLAFMVTAALFQLLALAVNYFLFAWAIGGGEANEFAISLLFVAAGVSFMAYSLVTAVISYGTYRDLRSHRAGVGELLARGVVAALAVALVAILSAIGISIGFALLIVPGIILAVWWWVAIPAAVIERPGIFAAFGRSRRLTKGSRWVILGLLLILSSGSWSSTSLLAVLVMRSQRARRPLPGPW